MAFVLVSVVQVGWELAHVWCVYCSLSSAWMVTSGSLLAAGQFDTSTCLWSSTWFCQLTHFSKAVCLFSWGCRSQNHYTEWMNRYHQLHVVILVLGDHTNTCPTDNSFSVWATLYQLQTVAAWPFILATIVGNTATRWTPPTGTAQQNPVPDASANSVVSWTVASHTWYHFQNISLSLSLFLSFFSL